MKKIVLSVLALMAYFTTTIYAANIEEGGQYVYVFHHPKSGKYVAWSAIVERYSGGNNAKVQVILVGEQAFGGGCRMAKQNTEWVSVSSLKTCDEAKSSLSNNGANKYAWAQWRCLCQ